AEQRGVPAYVIFHDATLRAIAAARPAAVSELDGIKGFGAAKLENYGAAVIELVSAAPDAATPDTAAPAPAPATPDAGQADALVCDV
ncbi:MAG: HRDC domain-containing protein, partial [Thermoleophilia bacterium]|nr:HRDC domain-containing protein [Thermoleophilia bacterium]